MEECSRKPVASVHSPELSLRLTHRREHVVSRMNRLALVALVSSLSISSLFAQIDRITGRQFATRSEMLARHGMGCTSVPLATQVGLDILKRGGSAVDSAIAANATL